MKFKLKHTGKAIIYSLLITQAVVQLILFIFFRHEDESTRIEYIFISFIFSFIGLFFGIMLCVVSEMEEREGECYFAGQLLSFLILLGLYLDRDSPEKIRTKKFETARDSYQYIYQDSDTKDNLFSKITVLKDSSFIEKFNADPNVDEEISKHLHQ